MAGPLITCIIPAYNSERYLAEALDSVLDQTLRPLEVIVVDDGSHDGTLAVATGYGDAVRLVCQANGGVGSARNTGLSHARGEFVAYLDADDRWHPEKLDRQLARFQHRPAIDLCLTHFQNFWAPELAAEARQYAGHPLSRPMWGYVFGTLLARRAFLERSGPCDEDLREAGDTHWFLRAIDRGAVVDVVSDVLMERRIHLTSSSRTRAEHLLRGYLRVAKARLDLRRQREARTLGAPP